MYLKDFQQRFDTTIGDFLQSKYQELLVHANDDILREMINEVVKFQTGGKRIRPFLIKTIYEGFTKDTSMNIEKAVLGYELIQCIALVHDDIMDKGTTRHGRKTTHKAIQGLYGSDEHTGNSQALLIGDWFLGRAYEVFYQGKYTDKANTYFNQCVQELVMGQMIDTHLSKIPLTQDKTLIVTKDRLKSGAYSFIRPMGLGGILANVDSSTQRNIEKLGEKLGAVYQMRDDLLDITGTHGHENKTRFSDLSEGNQTIVLHEALQRVSEEDKALILSHRGKSISSEDIDTIGTIIEASGALTVTKDQINTLLDESQVLLDHLIDSSKQQHTALSEIIDYLRV